MTWTNANDWLPEPDKLVLACAAEYPKFGVKILAHDRKEGWHNEKGVIFHGITHWQELPELPRGPAAQD